MAAATVPGVPEMAQVVFERLMPACRAGVMEQPVMAPPVLPGVCVAMATDLVAVRLAGL